MSPDGIHKCAIQQLLVNWLRQMPVHSRLRSRTTSSRKASAVMAMMGILLPWDVRNSES